MDKVSPEKRSEIMSKIRSKNTKVENLVFKELRKEGIYFQKHYKRCLGNPDIALPRKRKAVFIDGDFWHGNEYEKLKKRLPTNYWIPKIEKNIARDKVYTKKLKEAGWQVLRVWESDIVRAKTRTESMNKIAFFLQTD